MPSRRMARIAEAVREQVSTSILFELKDPRVTNVTVTRVEVSSDLRNAKVHVSIMGGEKTQRLSLRGLDSARGFLQSRLADRLQIRYTPLLRFQLDQGVKRSIEASRLLREVLPSPAVDIPALDAPGDIPALDVPVPDESARDQSAADPAAHAAGISPPRLLEDCDAESVRPAPSVTNSFYERHAKNHDG